MDPHKSHTWAVFTDGTNTVTISWLPATLRVRLLAAPEQGHNFSHTETVAWARQNGLRVKAWTVPISATTFKAAVRREAELTNRTYQATGFNCYRAADVSGLPMPRTVWGEAASAIVAGHLRGKP